MSVSDGFLLFLRVAHAIAAALWLGGGVYYLVIVRPAIRASSLPPGDALLATRQSFGELARTSTLVMVATGAVLMFDRLATDGEGVIYAALLAAKIAAAIGAFWLVSRRPGRRGGRTSRRTSELVLSLGMIAFVLGVVLASVFGRA